MPGTTQEASRTFYNNVEIGGGGRLYANGFTVDGVTHTSAEQGEPRQKHSERDAYAARLAHGGHELSECGRRSPADGLAASPRSRIDFSAKSVPSNSSSALVAARLARFPTLGSTRVRLVHVLFPRHSIHSWGGLLFQAGFLKKIEDSYGQAQRVWVMDRGIASEAILAEMRDPERQTFDLAGTPQAGFTSTKRSGWKYRGQRCATPWGEAVPARGRTVRAGEKGRAAGERN
jgi:hypothetical protein